MAKKKPDKPVDSGRDEEVSLSGEGPTPQQSDDAGKEESAPVVKMEQQQGTLSTEITPGMSNVDVVDAIIRTPTEQLIPWEQIELPSKGLYYDWTTGVIKVRAWGANVDKILATQRLVQTGQSVDYMLKLCCEFPGDFNPQDLLVGDQIFLLFYLRGITHGNIYEFAVSGPSGTTGVHKIDLNELAASITYAQSGMGNEPFRVDLPYLSKQVGRDVWVSVKFLRVRDSQIITRQRAAKQKALGGPGTAKIKKRKKNKAWQPGQPAAKPGQVEAPTFDANIPLDDTITQNLSRLIVDIMGDVSDRFKIEQFVNKLHSADLATIREWLADNTPGIETQVTLEDSESGDEFRIMLPITESFFRPQVA